ncbi:hypothetical protein SY88_04845 [Clostridiales bacterium PH28_bin88]|nr:hypothetical protein SY88_04845 [Clostridiales bacterium PH28_bin88]
MLELRLVSTKYGQIPMLRRVSLFVSEGEAVCILGANGAGKTTLLKTIIGMVKPEEGEVLYNGARIDLMSTPKIIQTGIAVVPEREGLFPKMSVEENLILGAYYEKDRNLVKQRLEEAYTIFPRLKERYRQRAGTLSGGERKMLGIARALLSNPKVLLMDEPSLGLAPAIVNEVFNVINDIKRNRQIAILVVEQNAHKALTVAERGYVLQKGEVVLEGTTQELEENDIIKHSYLKV